MFRKDSQPLLKKKLPENQLDTQPFNVLKQQILQDYESGIDVNDTSSGETLLHRAVNIGDKELIEFFMNKGANPHLLNLSLETPLSQAILHQIKAYDAPTKEIATIIIMHPRFSAGENTGVAIFNAINHNNPGVAETLVHFLRKENRAHRERELNYAGDVQGNTALHLAVTKATPLIKTLIANGSDLQKRNKEHDRPLDLLLKKYSLRSNLPMPEEQALRYFIQHVNCQSIECLLDLGANNALSVTQKINHFHLALNIKNMSVVATLIKHPSFQITDGMGYLIYKLVEREELELLKIMFNKAKSAEERNLIKTMLGKPYDAAKELTPLHLAYHKNNTRIVKLLLDFGADPTQKNKLNQSPLSMAEEIQKLEEKLFSFIQFNTTYQNTRYKQIFKKVDFDRIATLAAFNNSAKRLIADIHFYQLAPISWSAPNNNRDYHAANFYTEIAARDPYAAMMLGIINKNFSVVEPKRYLYNPNCVQVLTFYHAIKAASFAPSRLSLIVNKMIKITQETEDPIKAAALEALNSINNIAPQPEMLALLVQPPSYEVAVQNTIPTPPTDPYPFARSEAIPVPFKETAQSLYYPQLFTPNPPPYREPEVTKTQANPSYSLIDDPIPEMAAFNLNCPEDASAPPYTLLPEFSFLNENNSMQQLQPQTSDRVENRISKRF